MQRYSNVIQALVYAGAAFLVVIVGLRGVGDLSQIGFVPDWLLEEHTGRLSVNLVIFGLIAEFAMLMALAIVFYKSPRSSAETVTDGQTRAAVTVSHNDIAKLVEAERQIIEALGKRIETLVDTERKIIEQIGNKYNDLAEAQRHILELMAHRIDENQGSNDSALQRIESNIEFLKNSQLVRRRPHSETTPTMS